MSKSHTHLRPTYHLMPERNWMNDPNGLIQVNGVYHVFYQYNPNGAFWGSMHWGHATSTDLVHWTHQPIALAPDPDGPDADGCFSGAAVVHKGVPTLVYTGVRGKDELPCLAFPLDQDLTTWGKHPGNPVMESTPPGISTTIFRDHTLWRNPDTGEWNMGIGSGLEGQGGALLTFSSPDLETWRYIHPAIVEDARLNPDESLLSTGWECPDLFFIDGSPIFIACDWDDDPISVSYWTGDWTDDRMHPTHKGIVDAGGSLYAPQSFTDENDRRLLFGWLRERWSAERQLEAGWSGVMSLPRVITSSPDGTLAFRVADEIQTLREAHASQGLVSGTIATDDIDTRSCEVQLTANEWPSGPFSLRIGTDEHAVIQWNPARSEITIDTRSASVDPDVIGDIASAKLEGESPEQFSLRVFVDHSVIEVYLCDRLAMAVRVYPENDSVPELALEGTVPDGHVEVWQMGSAWD